MNLALDTAIGFVRARLDELAEVESDLLVADPENLNLDRTVRDSIAEAVDSIHLTAPHPLIEGLPITQDEVMSLSVDGKGVIDINLILQEGLSLLRFVSFRSEDSDIVITAPTEEDSPRGRMQSNKWIMGRKDNPTLVRMTDSTDLRPHYRYYTTELEEPRFELRYIPKAEIKDDSVWVCKRLELPILNHLTGIVLRSFREHDLAQGYFTKAAEYLG